MGSSVVKALPETSEFRHTWGSHGCYFHFALVTMWGSNIDGTSLGFSVLIQYMNSSVMNK